MYTKSSLLKIVAVSLILGVIFDYFFYMHESGLSFPVYVVLIIIGLLALAASFGKTITKQALLLLLPLGFFSIMVFVRASVELTFLNVLATIGLLLLIARVSFGPRLRSFFIIDYVKTVFLLPFSFFALMVRALSRIFSSEGSESRKVSPQIIKGIVITIPILILFVLLFSSADLIFQKYLTSIIDIKINPESAARIVLVLAASLAFLGAFSYVFSERKDEDSGEKSTSGSMFGPIESSILLGSVNALFLFFIILQLAYLFGGQSNISVQGFTYADYARRGFFELIGVAVFSFLILLGVEKIIAKRDGIHTLLFKALSGALILQVMVIMASAFKRLLLYEEAFGFTTMRFYSRAFIVFLAVIFVLLLYKIYRNKQENTLTFGVFVWLIVFLSILNLANPDAFIARRNIERFHATGKLDQDYLKLLSDDAAAEIEKVVQLEPREVRDTGWQSANLSRIKAQKLR